MHGPEREAFRCSIIKQLKSKLVTYNLTIIKHLLPSEREASRQKLVLPRRLLICKGARCSKRVQMKRQLQHGLSGSVRLKVCGFSFTLRLQSGSFLGFIFRTL